MYTIKCNRDSNTMWRWLILKDDFIVDFGYVLSKDGEEASIAAQTRLDEMRRYSDTGQITAYVEWIAQDGATGRTEGTPGGTHMNALFSRAVREGVCIESEVW